MRKLTIGAFDYVQQGITSGWYVPHYDISNLHKLSLFGILKV